MTSTLPAEIRVTRFNIDREESFTLSEELPWVSEILQEIDLDSENRGHLRVKFDIVRRNDTVLKNHLIIAGQVQLSYHTECIRCLENMTQNVDFEFNACFLPQELENSEEYQDACTVFINEIEMDLYFHQTKVDLKELLHENISLQLSPFPLHDENCKGLCPECGTNLNVNSCQHLCNTGGK